MKRKICNEFNIERKIIFHSFKKDRQNHKKDCERCNDDRAREWLKSTSEKRRVHDRNKNLFHPNFKTSDDIRKGTSKNFIAQTISQNK